MLNVELSRTPTLLEKVHFWAWWTCEFALYGVAQLIHTNGISPNTIILGPLLSLPLYLCLVKVRAAVHVDQTHKGSLANFVDSNIVLVGRE